MTTAILDALRPTGPFQARPAPPPLAIKRCHHTHPDTIPAPPGGGAANGCATTGEQYCRNCEQYWNGCIHDPCVVRRVDRNEYLHPACAEELIAGMCRTCQRSARRCQCRAAIVQGYHSERDGRGRTHVDTSADPLFGFEFEAIYPDVERAEAGEALAEALHPVAPLIWTHECDSSLGGQGIETITVPAPLTIWREILPLVVEAIATAGGIITAACGGHIHISRTPNRVRGGALLCASYLDRRQAPVWDAIADRGTDAYGSIAPVPAPPGSMPTSRAALWSARSTLEWRHPAGSLDPRVILGRAEILADTLDHASAYAVRSPGKPWGWGAYLRDRPTATPSTRYAWALLRSIGF